MLQAFSAYVCIILLIITLNIYKSSFIIMRIFYKKLRWHCLFHSATPLKTMQPFWNTKYQANHLRINFKKVLYPRIVIFYTATENIATVLENPIPGTHTNSRSLEYRGELWSKSSRQGRKGSFINGDLTIFMAP